MVWGFGGDNNTASKGWNLNNLLADANDGGRSETFANNVVEFVKAGQTPVAGSQPPANTDKDALGVGEAQTADGWTGGLSPLQRLQLNEVSRVKGFVDAGKAATSTTTQGGTDGQSTATSDTTSDQHGGQSNPDNGKAHPDKLSWSKHMWHYFFGWGAPLTARIEDVYHGEPVKFDEKNQAGFDTHGPAGRVVLKKLENGDIIAKPDLFDFDKREWGERDPSGFPYPKEVSTRIGAMLPGTPFYTNFKGTVPPVKGNDE